MSNFGYLTKLPNAPPLGIFLGRRGRGGRAIATLVLVVWLVNFLLLASRGEFEIIFFIVFSMLFTTNRCFLCQTFGLGFSIMATTVLDLAQTKQIDCQPFFLLLFSSWCSNMALSWWFNSNFHIDSRGSVALYNLFMHSSLANLKQDIFFSIHIDSLYAQKLSLFCPAPP